MKPIFYCVAFRKLAAHPARARAMRDDRGHPAHVDDRIAAGCFAKPLQLGHELKHGFLVNIVDVSSLAFTVRAQAQFETDDVFDYRFGVGGNQVRKEFIGLFVAGLMKKRCE